MIQQNIQLFDLTQREITVIRRLVAQAQFSADDFHFKMQCDDLDCIPIRIDDDLIRIAIHADEPLHSYTQACFLDNFPDARLRRGLA